MYDPIKSTAEAMDFVRTFSTQLQTDLRMHPDLKNFRFLKIKLDWSPRRTCHNGGWDRIKKGATISLAMKKHLLKTDVVPIRTDIRRVYEYLSYNDDPVIGGFYSNIGTHELVMVILHETAHGIQGYKHDYNIREWDKPHGESFKEPYRLLRERYLNPYLPNQEQFKAEYEKDVQSIVRG